MLEGCDCTIPPDVKDPVRWHDIMCKDCPYALKNQRWYRATYNDEPNAFRASGHSLRIEGYAHMIHREFKERMADQAARRKRVFDFWIAARRRRPFGRGAVAILLTAAVTLVALRIIAGT